MKFITEEDLRDLYKIEPFTVYDMEADTRLTPGARQFLVDRGIDMYGKEAIKNSAPSTSKNKSEILEKKKTVKCRKMKTRLNSIHALFLEVLEALLVKDATLAMRLVDLNRQFICLKEMAAGKAKAGDLLCQACTGINEENFSTDIGECFDITDFHLQLEKGSEIIQLHKLRCALQEFEPWIQDLYDSCEEENLLYEELTGKVNQIINILSQMICSAFGGEKCQRQR